jgi:hypothetical protein
MPNPAVRSYKYPCISNNNILLQARFRALDSRKWSPLLATRHPPGVLLGLAQVDDRRMPGSEQERGVVIMNYELRITIYEL